jgi:signal transduction histidine kinase
MTRRQLIALDAVPAMLVAEIELAETMNHRQDHSLPTAVGVGLALLLAASVAARRWRPVPALAVALVTSLAVAQAGFIRDPLVALGLVLYIVAVTETDRVAIRALVTVGACIVLTAAGAWLTGTLRSTDEGFVLGGSVIQVVAWMAGVAVRKQREYAEAMREQAVTEQRLRIAQELHDVVAHSMSVIAVQAGVGHHVMASRPDEAAKALAAIETTSREALQEMRRLLGVLREESSGADRDALRPAPRLADLPALVRRTGHAGLRVDLCLRGDLRTLNPGLELAAYRIVQEALTNIVKHSGTDRGRVVITYGRHELKVEVTDDGRRTAESTAAGRRPADPVPDGHGLIGMRERVALYAGRFDAGPRSPRGFRVAAAFPVDGATLTVDAGRP